MNPDAALQQLYIVRAQVELAIGLLEAPAGTAAPAAGPDVCLHPEGHRHDITTAGDGPARWLCDVCDQTFDGPLP
jgi:hypothetical protein